MPETNLSASGSGSARLTRFALVPACLLVTLLFTALLFPWEAVGRRVAWEINRVSAADVEMRDISPALTARGPVLRARDLVVDHPAVERVRLAELELAPRFSTSWFSGEPTIRVWAETSLVMVELRQEGLVAVARRFEAVREGMREYLTDLAEDEGGETAGRADESTVRLRRQGLRMD